MTAASNGPVQIRRLDARDRGDRLAHMARLGEAARRMRFSGGGSAETPPEPTLAEGAWINGALRGVAELYPLPARTGAAEIALSVEPRFQGRGIGGALLERLLVLARNRLIGRVEMVCGMENGRITALARRAGGRLSVDPPEAHAVLELLAPTPATLALEALDLWELARDRLCGTVRFPPRAEPDAFGDPARG